MRSLIRPALVTFLVLGLSDSLWAQAASKGKTNPVFIPSEAATAIVLRPRRIMAAPEFALMPVEVISAASKKELGADAAQIEEVVAFAAPQGIGEPLMGAVIRLSAPVRPQDLIPNLRALMTEAQYAGRKYLRGPVAPFVSLAVIDDKTLLVATEASLKVMLDSKVGDSSIHMLLGELDSSVDMAVLVSMENLRPILGIAMFALPPPPPAYQEFLKVPGLLSAIELKSTQGTGGKLELVLRGVDEDAAKELDRLAQKGIVLAREQILANLPPRDPDDLMGQATEKYLRRILDKASQWIRPTRTGDRLTLSVDNSKMQGSAGTASVMAALLLPAVARVREAALTNLSRNQMKQIVISFHSHEASWNTLPARANFDKQGKPLLSWRVHMLPFIDQGALYRKFRLDEPWDSEHNKQLIPLIPATYQSPTRKDTKTNYQVVVGPGSMFEGTTGVKFADITDGSSNTIALVEVGDDRAVIWTKPEDFVFDREKPLAGLGRVRPEGFNVGFADGTVFLMRGTISAEKLLGMFTRDGKEVVTRD